MGYHLGDCDLQGSYRYRLTVHTDTPGRRVLAVVQCNPSLASAARADPTVGKVALWAEAQGFAEVVYLNLFAAIAPRVDALRGRSYRRLVGPRNDAVLEGQFGRRTATIVLAWGADLPVAPAQYLRRVRELRALVDAAGHPVYRVGALSRGTHPRHGRMWNRGNRELLGLSWEQILPAD